MGGLSGEDGREGVCGFSVRHLREMCVPSLT